MVNKKWILLALIIARMAARMSSGQVIDWCALYSHCREQLDCEGLDPPRACEGLDPPMCGEEGEEGGFCLPVGSYCDLYTHCSDDTPCQGQPCYGVGFACKEPDGLVSGFCLPIPEH